MATETTYRPVTVTQLDRERWDDHDQLADGQGLAMAAIGFTSDQFNGLPSDESGDHPALEAWEGMVEEVFEELHPNIADLFADAIERHLPWRREPER